MLSDAQLTELAHLFELEAEATARRPARSPRALIARDREAARLRACACAVAARRRRRLSLRQALDELLAPQ